ncbi:MAG: DegV family protein [Clostridiales bacterium]|nr:DegV family protein [Clostridiales bacterium]MDO4351161.1 DegV family protein [Eubacteriales bacterium]MDY4008886.1 DegV family protein [Candidatus Limiplasma sp.]
MNPYVFMTDSDSDLPYRYVDELDLTMVYMPYMLNGKEYLDDLGRNGKQKEYFDNMRAGAAPVTSLLPTPVYVEYFEPCFQAGKDILFVAFSSQLSSTINNIYAAREELLAKYPERKMIVVDTLSISAPQTILILKAHELYRQGKSMEEVAEWLESNKLRAQAWFTVDDLVYLRRGGRISAVAATVGAMLDLKPIITENRAGKLVSSDKVRGRKAALRMLADKAAEFIDDPAEAMPIILQADAPEDAARLESLIRERVPGLGEIATYYVGPVIGAHCGPGTVAICFFGKERPC